ncbi:MAG: UbiA family prenyltransferase, partial [Xanthomonadales bacterium]|nr:UbiA family prenyltransferase [Xanthomonadales bacterium]
MSSVAGRYLELCKPKVVALIVFTAIVGMALAVPGWPPLQQFVAGAVGIALAAASAAAINHLLDQRIDAVMARTRGRPLPSGQLTVNQVLTFAFVLGAISMAMLIVWVNTLTAVLTFLSLIGYAIVYT